MDTLSKEQIDKMLYEAVGDECATLRRDIRALLAAQTGTGNGSSRHPVGANTPDANHMRPGSWRLMAIMPERIDDYQSMMLALMGGKLARPDIEVGSQAIQVVGMADGPRKGAVAILSLGGFLQMKPDIFTEFGLATSTQQFGTMFMAAMDSSDIAQVIIDVNSPGGEVSGTQELSALIYASRGKKPITAVADPLTASAAFWIATAADRLIMTPSGEVGSVGVVGQHIDYSEMLAAQGVKSTFISAGKYKVEGNFWEPLSEEGLAYHQARIDEMYGNFVSDLARNRNVSKSVVLRDFGQGRVLGAKAAKKAGMVDGIATLREVLSGISGKKSRNSASRANSEINLLTPSNDLR